jgi:hypothetical protein
MFRGREWRRLVVSGLENSSSSKAVTRSNAPESECTPCTVPGSERSKVRTYTVWNERRICVPMILAFRLSPLVKSFLTIEE